VRVEGRLAFTDSATIKMMADMDEDVFHGFVTDASKKPHEAKKQADRLLLLHPRRAIVTRRDRARHPRAVAAVRDPGAHGTRDRQRHVRSGAPGHGPVARRPRLTPIAIYRKVGRAN
jgi:hypothetical protein